MRVGIDCRTILNPGRGEQAGIGHYTYALVTNILALDKKTEHVLFFDSRMRREMTKEFRQPNVKIRYFPFSSYRKFLPFAYSHMLSAATLLKERLDLFHSPTTSMPLTYPKATVVTVHDLAIYVNPDWFPSQVFARRLLVPQTLRRARKIIAISHATSQDLEDLFAVPKKKITVIHQGVDTERLALKDRDIDVHKKYQLPEKYLFYVGTFEPRKNLSGLIEAYATLLKAKPKLVQPVPLVLAGAIGHQGDDVLEKIRGLGIEHQVRYVGYVTHNEKLNLIANAMAFVFPSLYEGFGLPIVEAMNLGTPVLTSTTSAMPEITGGAALLVDPSSRQALSQALERLIAEGDLRRDLRAKGLQRAKAFSWVNTARETIEVYRSQVRERLVSEASEEIQKGPLPAARRGRRSRTSHAR